MGRRPRAGPEPEQGAPQPKLERRAAGRDADEQPRKRRDKDGGPSRGQIRTGSERAPGNDCTPETPRGPPGEHRLHGKAPGSITRASAGLAQLVEHLICNQGAGGSSPSTGTNENNVLRA